MPRTAIPHHLIHNPEDVKRNADRFDDLCRLAEEVATPLVKQALIRETVATGAEALTDEAKNVLEMLVGEAIEELDDRRVIYQVRASLMGTVSSPDEEEYNRHSHEFSQILMSTWLESLRSAQAKEDVLVLSDFLLLEPPSNFIRSILEYFGSREELSQGMKDAFASFALTEHEAASIMSTLRLKLFPEPGLVDLPFNLVLLGAPEMSVLAMPREYYQRLRDEVDRQLEEMEAASRDAAEKRAREAVVKKSRAATPFSTAEARQAFASLTMQIPPVKYTYLARAASPNIHSKNISTRVEQVLKH